MKTEDVQKLYQQAVLPTYRQTNACLVKGKGSKVWDLAGREYLDFFPGWGVSGLGHCHPLVVSAIKDQAQKILHISNNYLNLKQAKLAEEIREAGFPSRTFFCNSGAEAAEGAIKLARRFGSKTGRYEVICMENAFHGRTLAAITATGQAKYLEGFQPLPEGFKHVPFNDFKAVEAAAGPKTAAVFLELIQGEGGINVASDEFVKKLRKFCDDKKILLMVDEVQTGMGRTGKIFAYQHYGIEPDVMTLAKSLGGGVPIGALVVREPYADILSPGSHASTYGGNPLVCAAALAVFKAIKKDRLLKNAEDLGAYLRGKLLELKKKYPVIKEVRGKGLMLGMELTVPGTPVVDKARELGLLINCTHDTVLRVMPAINVTEKMINQAVKILDKALAAVSK